MPVITISRLTGSGGAAIGRQLAEQLGAGYLNKQIVREAAAQLQIPEEIAADYNERAETFFERLTRALWVAGSTISPLRNTTPMEMFQSPTELFLEITRHLVREAARTGNAVIFGHGGQFILAGEPGVLHVRFVAPFPYRVGRVMTRARISQAAAEQYVQQEDRRRAKAIHDQFQADWHALDPFHLLLNTALLDQEICIRLILDAVAALENQK